MGFDEKVVTFEELLMSQVVSQEALTRLLVDNAKSQGSCNRNKVLFLSFLNQDFFYLFDCFPEILVLMELVLNAPEK